MIIIFHSENLGTNIPFKILNLIFFRAGLLKYLFFFMTA